MAAMIACAFSHSNVDPKSFYKNNSFYTREDSKMVLRLHYTLKINLKLIVSNIQFRFLLETSTNTDKLGEHGFCKCIYLPCLQLY